MFFISADTINQLFSYFLAVGSLTNTVALFLSSLVGVYFTLKIFVFCTPPGYSTTFFCTLNSISSFLLVDTMLPHVPGTAQAFRVFCCSKREAVGVSLAVTTLQTSASSLCVSRLGAKVVSGVTEGLCDRRRWHGILL
jgi:hypothetical protein